MKLRIRCTVRPGSWLIPFCDWADTWNADIKRLAPSRWKFHLSLPDSKRSRNIRRNMLATVLSRLCKIASWRAPESSFIARHLKDSASCWAFIVSTDVVISDWWKDRPVLALWHAARARTDCKRIGSSRARAIRLRKGFSSLSYTMKSLHMWPLSVISY